MRKLVAALVMLALIAALAPAALAQAPVEITLWGAWAETGGPGASIAAFNQLHPQINVTYVQYANNEEGNVKLETSLLAGQSVDVFWSYSDFYTASRAENGLLMDLTPFIQQSGIDMASEFGNCYTYNGAYYALPASSVQVSVWINKDMLDAAGLPVPGNWTCEEYMAYARALTQGEGSDKVYGACDMHKDINYWALPARGLLGANYWYDEAGLSNFDDPAFLSSLQMKYDLEVTEQVQFPYTELNATGMKAWEVFLQQDCAMVVCTNAIARFLKDQETYPRDFDVVCVPYPTLNADQAFDYNQGMFPYGYLAMSSSIAPDKAEAAWTFLAWMAREGSNGICWVGHLPAWTGNNPGELLPDMLGPNYDSIGLDLDAFMQCVMNYSHPGYSDSIHVAYATINNILNEELEKALYQEQTPAQAVANMKTRSDEAILAEKN